MMIIAVLLYKIWYDEHACMHAADLPQIDVDGHCSRCLHHRQSQCNWGMLSYHDGQPTFIHNTMIMFRCIIHSLLPCWRWFITIVTKTTCLTLSWITSKFVYRHNNNNIKVYLISCYWLINFYSVEAFIPEMYRGDHQGRISAAEIDKKCSDLSASDEQKDHKDYVADVVSMCSKLHGCYGVFYDITVSLYQD